MLELMSRAAAAVALIAVLAAASHAQQTPDTDFDMQVPRPAFAATPRPEALFDAAHHNLFTADDRYAPLAGLARNDGWDVEINRVALTPDLLSKTRLLVIADPLGAANPLAAAAEGPAFTRQECDAVVSWVQAGGGLLFVAEHAPSGVAARGLAALLGIDMSAGFLSDAALQDSTIGGSTLLFSRATGNVADHPITRGRDSTERVDRVKTFTGQSLLGPEGSTMLLKLSDYATDNMIRAGRPPGPIPDSLVHSARGRAQAVAFTLGKGRVVALAEGAMLSAHLMRHGDDVLYRIGMSTRDADNRQFAINVLRWLGGALN